MKLGKALARLPSSPLCYMQGPTCSRPRYLPSLTLPQPRSFPSIPQTQQDSTSHLLFLPRRQCSFSSIFTAPSAALKSVFEHHLLTEFSIDLGSQIPTTCCPLCTFSFLSQHLTSLHMYSAISPIS